MAVAEADLDKGRVNNSEHILEQRPSGWRFPDTAVILTGTKRSLTDLEPKITPVLDHQGKQIGQLYQARVVLNEEDKQASLEFRFQINSQGQYSVVTEGDHSWSSYERVARRNGRLKRKTIGYRSDNLVGMKPIELTLGAQRQVFYELDGRNEKLPKDTGRSYGLVCFRDVKGGENFFLGIIPAFDSNENIFYKLDDKEIVVTIQKKLNRKQRQDGFTEFKVLVGQGNPRRGGDGISFGTLVAAFSEELGKSNARLRLMQGRIIGFSWASIGFGVNQAFVEKELEAGQGLIDTYFIDDGWQVNGRGSYEFVGEKFPSIEELIRKAKQRGIKMGIWTSPFMVDPTVVAANPKLFPREWFLRDRNDRLVLLPVGPLPQSTPKPLIPVTRPYIFDISNPAVREYLLEKHVKLAKLGFEVFKMDFLTAAFVADQHNQDSHPVEFYRKFFVDLRNAQFFEELRNLVRAEVGEEVEIIGCGAPMMESIGLFEGIRMTPDSALPNLKYTHRYGGLIGGLYKLGLDRVVAGVNSDWYQGAKAVAAKRVLPFSNSLGLIFDGIHLGDDPEIPINPTSADPNRQEELFLALAKLGINNLFVGDSLSRLSPQGLARWRRFVETFKDNLGYS
ncbi:alpha-galactosidase [Candidatus Daviesbacteria bacterium]|nr:alpha-galactosidase [Candidatus Daviesbacteria bacterium]